MNDKKICFIMCVNRWSMAEEAKYYIDRLYVPEGYSIDFITIEDADSMCAGYNAGMEASDAKYKVYLHQDVFIINRNFIFDILKIFNEDEKIGMIGLAGAEEFAQNAVQWKSYSIGHIYTQAPFFIEESCYNVEETYVDDKVYVESVDGLLMATQYDIPWREDVFDKWDFYDSSQSFEFRKRGLKIAVPVCDRPWCIHYDGFLNLKNYYGERIKFLETYKEELNADVSSNPKSVESGDNSAYEKIQKLLLKLGEVNYEGIYLWKYLMEDISQTVIPDEKGCFTAVSNDDILVGTEEAIDKNKAFLESLPEKDILFGLYSVRRDYQGKIRHTAADDYIDTIDKDRYVVIECDKSEPFKDILYTSNVHFYNYEAIISMYGEHKVDFNQIVDFVLDNYILPVSQALAIDIPKEKILSICYKASKCVKKYDALVNFYIDVLKRVKPKVVCTWHTYIMEVGALCDAAYKLGIPSIEVEHGAGGINLCSPRQLRLSDYYFIQTDIMKEHYRSNGGDYVYAIGKPGIYSMMAKPATKEEQIVVCFVSSARDKLIETIRAFAKVADPSKYLILVKLHPFDEYNQSKYDELQNEFLNLNLLDGVVDVRRVFPLCDVVIGMFSSAMTDAFPYDEMEVISIEREAEGNFFHKHDFFERLIELGELIEVEDDNQLVEEIYSYERGRKYRGRPNSYWPEQSDTLFRDYIYKIIKDGKI